MAKAYTNVNSTTGTFAGWLSKSNELFYDMSTMIVTVADVAAPNSSNESRTTGNADIQGIFSANNIVVWDTLAGGRNEEWANTDTLYIVSNTQIGNSSQTDTLTVYGDATFDANVQIGSAATDGLTIAANTVVNGLSFFTANTRFNDNARISFGTDSDTSLYHDGSDLKLIHNNANTSDFIIEDVSGNDVFTFTTDHSTFTVARYDDATDGPSIVLLDEGTTPDAANVGGIFFKGQDSGSAITEYAAIKGIAEDNTNTTEDGALLLYTTIGGTAKAMIAVNEASDTAVSLRFDGSEKLATKTDGVDITGELQSDSLDVDGVADISGVVTLGANANFGDADQANFGAAADLQIFHDATDSHIKDNGTGNLKISSSQIDFLGGADGAETMATMVDDGAVTLYHNNAVKFATLATGVVVTGDTGTDTLTVGGGYGSTGLAIAATGNIQTNGTLTVDGLATLNAGIAVDTNKFTVADTTGNVSTAGTLGVTGISTLGIINASGLASLDGGIDVDGAFTVTNTSGNIATSGTLGVTGISTLGVINASGLASLDAGIDVDGAFTVADTTGNVVTSGTLGVTGVSTLGIINASGLASLNGGIAVDANFTVNGTSGATVIGSTLNVTGTSTLVAINSSGLASLDGGINVNDDFTVDVNGNVVGVASTFSGLTSADGGIDVNTAKFTVAAAGDTVIAATTASTSSTTGALKVAGGTGIAGKLFVGDDVNVAGDLVVDGTATFAGGGQLTVNNSIVTTLSVTGDTDIGSGASDTVTINASVDSNIVPSTDSARDLGTTSLRWANAYIDDLTLTANVNLQTRGSALFYDADNSNFVAFKSPATVASNITWTLPDADATTSGFALVSNASGVLSWAAAGSVTTTSDTSTNANELIYFGDTTSGAITAIHNDAGLTYNPSTGTLTSDAFAGVASSATTAVTLTGLTSTVAELNKVDGGTAASSITAAGADRVVYNDAGVMKQVALTTLDTYFSGTTKTLTNKTLTSPTLNTPSIGTSFTFDSITVAGIQTSAESFVDNDTSLMTSGAINDRIAVVAQATIDADSSVMQLNSAATKTSGDLTFNDSVAINLGTDADAEILHDGTNLLTDINTGNFQIRDGADSNATRFTFTPSSSALEIKNADAAGSGPTITLKHDSASPAASDEAGQIFFQSDNDAAENVTYARIDALIADVSDGSEDGSLKLKVYQGGTLRDHITAESGVATLYHNGSAKLATASGGVTITGTATATTFSGSGASLTALPAASLTGNIASARLTSVPAASLTGNIDDDRLPASITSDITGTAAKVTVTDSTTNTNFPVVFHNESNGLLDDTGALRYNPSTGTLLVPNLTVAGTTTQVDTVTMNAANAIVFEGATPDNHETTLTITDPTADRTITLPNATGTVALTSSDITGNAATATTLATARDIGGVSFNGSASINLPGVNTAGNQDTSGTAAVATVATTVTITDNESTNENNAIVFTAGGDVDGGNLGLESDGTLTYNPSTGKITATGFVGALTGNADTVTNGVYTSRTLTAGTGLTGGGTLAADRTFAIDSTVTTLTGSQTLTNKTLTSPSIGTGFTFDGITITAVQTSGESFVDNNTSLMTSAAIDDRINAAVGVSALNDLSDAKTNSSGGTIGIGTDALANDDGTTNLNTAIGYKAGEDVTSGAGNFFGGHSAGLNATTANNTIAIGRSAIGSGVLTGTDNTAIGYQAGYNATTADYTVAIGYSAIGLGVLTGSDNIAIGRQAGYDLTTGDDNFFAGYNAGSNATEANYAIAIGREAMWSGLLTGTDNTAIGRLAGKDLSTGNYNTFIGLSAGFAATTATNAIAIGYLAMGVGVLTGADNIAIGRAAGADITSGANNTFIGLAAGTNVTTGGDNTILGPSAGDALTTGSNNIIIGHDAAASAVGVSNEITIGDTNVTKFRLPGAGFEITSGAVVATGDITAFGSISDIRLKENIEPITNALDKVSQIGGYTFAYKKNPDVRMTGVIAQEVEKVLPEVIYTTADINSGEENLAVRYENMIGLLVEAIKELKTEVEELKKGK